MYDMLRADLLTEANKNDYEQKGEEKKHKHVQKVKFKGDEAGSFEQLRACDRMQPQQNRRPPLFCTL